MVKMFRLFTRKLGPLRSWSIEDSARETSVGTESYEVTRFDLKARFAKAPADVYIEIFKQAGSWKLGTLRVNSDAFLE